MRMSMMTNLEMMSSTLHPPPLNSTVQPHKNHTVHEKRGSITEVEAHKGFYRFNQSFNHVSYPVPPQQ